jgi:DNA-binding NarL/FixJ family response regulator
MSIRVCLIDENQRVRGLLAMSLQQLDDIAVVGETGDPQEGVRLVQELQPDVTLLEVKMREANGLEVCRKLVAADGHGKVVVLTSYVDQEERRQVHQAGAAGYLLKEIGTSKLGRELRRLAHGSSVRTGQQREAAVAGGKGAGR